MFTDYDHNFATALKIDLAEPRETRVPAVWPDVRQSVQPVQAATSGVEQYDGGTEYAVDGHKIGVRIIVGVMIFLAACASVGFLSAWLPMPEGF